MSKTTLPETNSLHLKMDGWNTFSFPFGILRIFRGDASCREGNESHVYILNSNLKNHRSIENMCFLFQVFLLSGVPQEVLFLPNISTLSPFGEKIEKISGAIAADCR